MDNIQVGDQVTVPSEPGYTSNTGIVTRVGEHSVDVLLNGSKEPEPFLSDEVEKQ